jgi:hypothetical protein
MVLALFFHRTSSKIEPSTVFGFVVFVPVISAPRQSTLIFAPFSYSNYFLSDRNNLTGTRNQDTLFWNLFLASLHTHVKFAVRWFIPSQAISEHTDTAISILYEFVQFEQTCSMHAVKKRAYICLFRVREVPGSNLGTKSLTYSWFYQHLQKNSWVVSQITPQTNTSTHFQNHYSSVTLSFNAIQSELLTASLNK